MKITLGKLGTPYEEEATVQCSIADIVRICFALHATYEQEASLKATLLPIHEELASALRKHYKRLEKRTTKEG